MRKPRRGYRRGSAPVGLKQGGCLRGTQQGDVCGPSLIPICLSISRPRLSRNRRCRDTSASSCSCCRRKARRPRSRRAESRGGSVRRGSVRRRNGRVLRSSLRRVRQSHGPRQSHGRRPPPPPRAVARVGARATAAPMAAVTAIAITVFRDMGASSSQDINPPGRDVKSAV